MTKIRRIMTTTGIAAGGSALLIGSAPAAFAETQVQEPSRFTSAFTVMAMPNNIINNDGQAVAGEEGATGTFNYRINSDEEIICYDITLNGVTPPYQSPAKTATHIHEAAQGQAGPPRIAFPNPTNADGGEAGETLKSSGCLQGPFTTGVVTNGADTGDGFSLKEIEDNPSAFFSDTHTSAFAAGAVRGQLQRMPVGGVDTGAGGTASSNSTSNINAIVGVSAGAVAGTAVGIIAYRRFATASN